MARRNRNTIADDLLGDLHKLFVMVPWWAGPPIIGLTFALFRWFIPPVLGPGDGLLQFDKIFHGLAPVFAGLVAFCWIMALVVKRRRCRLLENQSGLESIRAMGGLEFEHLVGEIYRRQGYMVEEKGGAGADGGIDLVLIKNGKTTLVQCKHWKQWKIGVRPIREFFGVMAAEGNVSGKFIATGSFTADAVAFAQGKTLELIDGESLWKLVEVMRAARTNVANGAEESALAEPDQTLLHEPPHRDSSNIGLEPDAAGSPECPRCNSIMIKREAKRGANAGSTFWGCSQYPKCRGIRSV